MLRTSATLMLLLCLCGCGGSGLATIEPPPGTLPNGESVLVNDGKCPATQVSKVTAPTTLTGTRTYQCVAKPGDSLF